MTKGSIAVGDAVVLEDGRRGHVILATRSGAYLPFCVSSVFPPHTPRARPRVLFAGRVKPGASTHGGTPLPNAGLSTRRGGPHELSALQGTGDRRQHRSAPCVAPTPTVGADWLATSHLARRWVARSGGPDGCRETSRAVSTKRPSRLSSFTRPLASQRLRLPRPRRSCGASRPMRNGQAASGSGCRPSGQSGTAKWPSRKRLEGRLSTIAFVPAALSSHGGGRSTSGRRQAAGRGSYPARRYSKVAWVFEEYGVYLSGLYRD